MNGPHDKLDFVPDPSTLTGSEDLMARRIEEDSILEYREEEVREAAHKKLWTQVLVSRCSSSIIFKIFQSFSKFFP